MNRLIATLLLCFFTSFSFASKQLDNEASGFIKAFNSGSFTEIKNVLGELKWKGIANQEVYDALLNQYNVYKEDVSKHGVKKTAHIVMGLATSGNDIYKTILEKDLDGVNNRYLKKYYKRAISEFELYARINPEISKGLEQAEDIEIKRIENMLNSNDFNVLLLGGKRVYYAHYTNKKLLKITEKRLIELYPQVSDNTGVQAVAYLAKSLSTDKNYKDLLIEVSNKASSKKLRKYAKKYLKSM